MLFERGLRQPGDLGDLMLVADPFEKRKNLPFPLAPGLPGPLALARLPWLSCSFARLVVCQRWPRQDGKA